MNDLYTVFSLSISLVFGYCLRVLILINIMLAFVNCFISFILYYPKLLNKYLFLLAKLRLINYKIICVAYFLF